MNPLKVGALPPSGSSSEMTTPIKGIGAQGTQKPCSTGTSARSMSQARGARTLKHAKAGATTHTTLFWHAARRKSTHRVWEEPRKESLRMAWPVTAIPLEAAQHRPLGIDRRDASIETKATNDCSLTPPASSKQTIRNKRCPKGVSGSLASGCKSRSAPCLGAALDQGCA